jgi:hypothetical protein
MQTNRLDRLALRIVLLCSLILAALTLVLALSPTSVSLAQGQATPPPRDTPAPTRPAPGPERGTVPPPTVPAGSPQPGGTPVPTPAALPSAGGALSIDMTWLFVGVALVVLAGLVSLRSGRSRRSPG